MNIFLIIMYRLLQYLMLLTLVKAIGEHSQIDIIGSMSMLILVTIAEAITQQLGNK